MMALTALAAESGKVLLVALSLVSPFGVTTGLETVFDKSLDAIIADDPENGETTIDKFIDEHRGSSEGGGKPVGQTEVDKDAHASADPGPVTLKCVGKDCPGKVTVHKQRHVEAAAHLERIHRPGRGAWHYSGNCENKDIDPGDSCTFRIWAGETPADPSAHLVVHDNTPDAPSKVAVTITGTTRGRLVETGREGILSSDCTNYNATVTVMADGGPVDWTTHTVPAGIALTASPSSGSLSAGDSQTIRISGRITTAPRFTFSIRGFSNGLDYHVTCAPPIN